MQLDHQIVEGRNNIENNIPAKTVQRASISIFYSAKFLAFILSNAIITNLVQIGFFLANKIKFDNQLAS